MAAISTVPSAVAGNGAIGAQGALGGFAGNPALSGLFSLLMGHFGEGAEAGDGGLLGALLGGDAEGNSELLSLLQNGAEGSGDFANLFDDMAAQLTALDGAVAGSGEEAQGLSTLLGQVQQAIQGLKEAAANGEITVGLSEGEEKLYVAFKEMGYSAEEAQNMAKQLETAFETLESAQQNGTDLLALLEGGSADAAAAAALAQAGLQAENSRVVQVSQTFEMVTTQQASISFQTQAKQAPITNLAEKIHAEQPLMAEAAVEGEVMKQGAPVEDAPLPHTAEGAKTHVNHVVERSGATVEKPNVFGGDKANQMVDMQANADSGDEGVTTQTARAVKAPAPIEGQTMFQWKQTATGMDVLEQMPEAPRTATIEGAIVDGMADEAGEVAEQAKTASGKQMSFAEKMAEMARVAQLGNQVQPAVKTLLEEGGGTIRVSLNPAELGEVEIELELKDGTVQGKIAAQNPEALEQLARELHHLKQGFADAGLNLGDDGIAFLLQNEDEGGGSQQFAEGDDADGMMGEDGEPEMDMAAGQWTDPTRALDMRV